MTQLNSVKTLAQAHPKLPSSITLVIGSGNRRRTATALGAHAKDVHRSIREDEAEAMKRFLFGPNYRRNGKGK